MRHNRHHPRTRTSPTVLTCLNPDVAGIDCGAAEHYVAVPPDRDSQSVHAFSTLTDGLHRLADWLTACRVKSVAMEATGVDWIPVYERLEVRGFDVRLVNARHLKHVPGRNSEVTDAEWLRDLHSVGLLRGSFRPTAAITTLRADLRHRHTLVESAGIYTQRIEKALVQMDVHLTQVVSDITGVTGLRMLRDIVAGQRDPHRLAAHRDARCRASAADIVAALTGHSSPEHLFVLPQNLELFDMCQRQLTTCADAIDAQWATLMAAVPPRAVHPGPARHPQGARQ